MESSVIKIDSHKATPSKGPVIVKVPVRKGISGWQILSDVYVSAPLVVDQEQNKITANINNRKLQALWDTGATHTCAIPRVVEDCHLKFAGYTTMTGIDNMQKQRELYFAAIAITESPLGSENNLIAFHPTTVVKLEENDQLKGVDLLIGMDLITVGDFWLTGGRSDDAPVFNFCYPSTGLKVEIQREESLPTDSNKRKNAHGSNRRNHPTKRTHNKRK